MKKYDLIVMGSGPAGEKAAVKAAYFKKKVAIIEKEPRYGGAGVHTGTLPSKTLKESALYFSGKYDKGLYGVERELKNKASIKDFMWRKNFIIDSQNEEVRNNIILHDVDIYHGGGSFETDHVIKITGSKGEELIYGENILIATGSYPYQPPDIPFDKQRVHDSDTILELPYFPSSICVVGAGVIGCEYATIFGAMGAKVFLVNNNDRILGFLDNELSSELVEQMKRDGIEILFNTSFEKMTVPEDDKEPIVITLKTGETLEVDMFLYAAGRSANTKLLNCEKAGVQLGKREVVSVDKDYRSSVPHIFAVGDVIGFPALASTSMDQGRVAVSHIFGIDDLKEIVPVFPYGIYTIPEVSMVGLTEEQAREKGIDYVTGKARYRDMPRGKIMGVQDGFLKLIFRRDTLEILGVHIIGPIASEIIHYGMMLVHNHTTIPQILAAVFNYPTLHDLYKYACYDGLGNRSGHKIKK
ncbi:MAG: NAD(P)(+) transhydrogenase [Ignavibacteriales bacterium]